MTPNLIGGSSIILAETTIEKEQKSVNKKHHLHDGNDESTHTTLHKNTSKNKRYEIIWQNTILLTLLHIGSLYGFYLIATKARLITFITEYVITVLSGIGVTAGAHRLWCHRSYKANIPLKLILVYLHTAAFQKDIYDWVRDHRVHHKFNDTDADPHNSKRGFFFSHVGWLMVRKHNDVKVKGATVDLSDLERDPIVMFQRKYYYWIAPICSFVIPALIPYYLLNEPLDVVFYACTLSRYVLLLNITWSINSVAHLWGSKPFDKNMSATDGVFAAINSFGEGWHNYHHTFPWDYKAAELGGYHFNLTKAFIDFFAKIGWAYDLKTVKHDLIESRIKRTGDGTHPISIKEKTKVIEELSDEFGSDEAIWGWDDKDMTQELRDKVTIINPHDKEL